MKKAKQWSYDFLKKSEIIIKTDMVYLAKGGFWAIISQIVVSLITFGLAIAFAHFISKESYGQYKYILSIATILGAFTLTGLNTAVLQSVSNGFEGALNYAFWENIRWSLLFFLGAAGISIYYFIHGNILLGFSLLIVGCVWPFFSSTNLYSPFLVAKKDFRRLAIYFNILGNLFPSLCLFVTIILTNNPAWLVSVYVLSNTLIGIILYMKVLKIYKPNRKIDTEMMSYSKHLSFVGILGTIGDNIDQVLVFHYVGAIQLAIYNFAIAIPNQIKGPLKNLTNLIFPKFTERSDKEIRSGMRNKFLYLLLTSVIIIALYILAAPYIFHIFFPKYSDSIIYSQIFSLSLLWMVSIPADTYLSAKKKIKQIYIGNISGSIIQIIIVFVGIIWGGLLGLVIARVITRLVWSTTSIFLYNRVSQENI